jgi:hypothetical protein
VPAAAAPKERVAVIDLGPPEPDRDRVRQRLAAALVAAGLEPLHGDRIEDALAGEDVERDALELASALARAEAEFGRLDCKGASEASRAAMGIAAQRQAAGLAVPELPRALAYLLLCADRTGDTDAALFAARSLRAIGGSPDVPADVWRKYPEIDTTIDRELVRVTVTTDVAKADVWIDFRPAGTSPLEVWLPAGEHVIAVAGRGRRGWAAGTAVATQPTIAVPTRDVSSPWSEVAHRVASWKGQLPTPQELGWVMAKVRARIAVVRTGDQLEAYGRIGLSEAPRRLGDLDGVRPLDEVDKLAALILDRVQAWNDRAPDPDRPLLVEDPRTRGDRGRRDLPTRWWVYASIFGAIAAGAIVIYANDAGTDKQRVELHQP